MREYAYYANERKAKSGRRTDLFTSGSLFNTSSPVGFLVKVPKGTHFVMFYENVVHARNLQLWYLMHGLLRNEDCVFVSYDTPEKTRSFLANHEFNIDYFESELGLLHIRQITDPREHKDGMEEGIREAFETMVSGISHPARVVATTFPEIRSEEESNLNISVESSAHDAFRGNVEEGSPYSLWKGLDGSLMCYYAISGNRARYYREWVKKCGKNHDVALYVPREGRVRFTRSPQSAKN